MSRIGRRLLMLAALAASAAIVPSQAVAAASTTFSGQATVVKGTVLGVPVTLVDTGPVAAEGGDLEANLLCYPAGNNCTIGGLPDVTNGALRAQVLHAAVVAQGNQSRAEASVAEIGLNVAGNTISAEFLEAEAEARCADGKAFVSGSAEIAELTINGQTIEVTGEANQTVALPGGGFVVINEQTGSASADKGDITVSALHVVIPGVVPGTETDLYIAQAHADIVCAQPRGCRGSRVTGGGWYEGVPIGLTESRRVHFALAARDGLSSWGHLMYMDKALDLKVKGTPLAATIFPNGKNDGEGTVTGTASANRKIDGQDVGFFEVVFVDAGEPGRSDQFAIVLLTAERSKGGVELYRINVDASGTLLGTGLSGGNLQVHACK